MKRSERHQLKQDEFVHWLERLTDWSVENRKNLVNVTLVIVGGLLLLSGLYVYRGQNEEASRAQLAEALEQYHGVVRSEGEGQAATGPVFETAEAKYRAALESFQQVADEFSGYDAGRKARYYIGLCHAALAEYEEAISVLSELRSGDRDLGYYLATKSLAQVQAASGDYVGAASTLRTLVEDSANPLPMDFLLFDLAKAEERAGNTAQARQYYERVLEEFPQSQIRGDVTARRDLLDLELQS